MSDLRYHLLDVFCDRPFGGNQLAVFVDPPDLDDASMQRIARELQLSETVFCRRPGPGASAWPTRIFTPEEELPFAGHPTVGTGVLLRSLGLAADEVTLAEGVGDVAMTLANGWASFATARLPEPVEVVDPEHLVRSIGLELGDLHPHLRASGWSAGVPFAVIPLRSVELLERAEVDVAYWRDEVRWQGADQLYPVAPLDGTPASAEWRVRMFAPGIGIAEDPATGSAAAAFAGVLVGHATPDRLAEGWVLHQGVEMGRPSRIEVSAAIEGNELRGVRLAGHAVRVGEGVVYESVLGS